MEGISVVMPQEDMVVSKADEAELKLSRSKKRVTELLMKASQSSPARCISPFVPLQPPTMLEHHISGYCPALQAEAGSGKASHGILKICETADFERANPLQAW